MGLVHRAIQDVIAELAGNAGVLRVREIRSQVEICKVYRRPLRIFRYHAVKKYFDSIHFGNDCRSVIRVLYPVASDREARSKFQGAVVVGLLDTNEIHIRDLPVRWDDVAE